MTGHRIEMEWEGDGCHISYRPGVPQVPGDEKSKAASERVDKAVHRLMKAFDDARRLHDRRKPMTRSFSPTDKAAKHDSAKEGIDGSEEGRASVRDSRH